MKFITRGFVSLYRFSKKFRYALCSILVYGLFYVSLGVVPIATSYAISLLLVVLGMAALSFAYAFSEGGLQVRRRVEAALAFLLAIDVFSRFQGAENIHYAAFPLFLIFVYFGYRVGELLFLLLAFALIRSWDRFGSGDFATQVLGPMGFLMIWLVFAWTYRTREKRKLRSVSDQLSFYEQEAQNLRHQAEGATQLLRQDEKSKMHLATMIREREKTFRNLIDILWRTFEPHTCALYLFDPLQERFILKDHLTKSDRFSERRFQELEGVFRAVLHEHQTIRLTSSTGQIRGLNYYQGASVVSSAAISPIRVDGALKGILIIDRLEPEPYSEDETDTIEQIAHQLGRSIDFAEALHTYFSLKEELSSFFQASTSLNRSLKIEDVLATLLESTRSIVMYDWSAIVLYDENADENRVALEYPHQTTTLVGKRFRCKSEKGLVSWVIKNQMPLSYNHFRSRASKTPLLYAKGRPAQDIESVCVFPLRTKQECLGAVVFASTTNQKFSSNIRRMLEVVALQAATSLKNAQMVRKLEELATTDGLTGLMNHRTFQEVLQNELSRADRHPEPVSLLLVDIDFFKKFNDEYGHPIGDAVLKEMAQVLSRTVRNVDFVARYGGEEFAVVLPHTTPIGAIKMAERIVSAVSQHRVRIQGMTLKITVSVGAATYPDHATSRESLIDFADRALYASKDRGRNRATLFELGLAAPEDEKKEESMIEEAEEVLRRVDHSSSTV